MVLTELGNVNDVKEVHVLNTEEGNFVTDSGITMETKELQFSNMLCPISVKLSLFGRVTEANELQPLNVKAPTSVTESGMTMETKELQFLNTEERNSVTESGITMETKELQFSNMLCPKSV